MKEVCSKCKLPLNDDSFTFQHDNPSCVFHLHTLCLFEMIKWVIDKIDKEDV